MKSFFNTSNKNFFKLIPDDNTNTNTNECDTNNDPYSSNNLNEINYYSNTAQYDTQDTINNQDERNDDSFDEDECGKSQHDYRNDQRRQVYNNYNFIGSDDRSEVNLNNGIKGKGNDRNSNDNRNPFYSEDNGKNNQYGQEKHCKTNQGDKGDEMSYGNVIASPKMQLFDDNTE